MIQHSLQLPEPSTQTQTHNYTYKHKCTHTHTYKQTHTHTQTHTHKHTNTRTYKNTNTQTHEHEKTHSTYTHTHIHTDTHTEPGNLFPLPRLLVFGLNHHLLLFGKRVVLPTCFFWTISPSLLCWYRCNHLLLFGFTSFRYEPDAWCCIGRVDVRAILVFQAAAVPGDDGIHLQSQVDPVPRGCNVSRGSTFRFPEKWLWRPCPGRNGLVY